MILKLRLYKYSWKFNENKTISSVDFPGDSEFLIDAAAKRGIEIVDMTWISPMHPRKGYEILIVDIVSEERSDADVVITKITEHLNGSVYSYNGAQFTVILPHVLETLGLSSYPQHLSFVIHGAESWIEENWCT